jgi:hypothetical protein
MVAGLVLTPIGLPGNWLILACAAAYGFITGWEKFGWRYIGFLAGAALIGEVLELISASVGARRYGSSRGGEVAAFVGTIIGALVGSGIAPIVGSLVGAFAGAFLGAFLYEYSRLNDLRHSVRSGMGALLGRTVAVVIKETIGVIMVGTVIYYFFV